MPDTAPLPTEDGLVVVVKRDCPTCELTASVLETLAAGRALKVYSQDDPGFPEGLTGVVDDTALDMSHRLGIEIVPTLIRFERGREVDRTWGWDRAEWERVAGLDGLGTDLPAQRPGCGARNVEPGVIERLKVRFGETGLASRRVSLGAAEDEIEACFEREWSDGLPVVPPTEERVLRMLQGTTRDPAEVLGLMPPNLDPCTVEKVAVNAVMAGCKPEYMPVVLAAVEAAIDDAFNMHGVLATTMYVGPVVIVNGPVRRHIGMNGRGNALGQGNRANATIGRALQLVVRNVGGGRPQGVDRATLGNPGKYTYCFAEDEEGSCWEPLSVALGFAPGVSTVTLFAGYGLQGVVDQKSREPESLTRSFAASLRAVSHVKAVPGPDILLVISPEHERTYREAGWSRADFEKRLYELLEIPGEELIAGVGGMAEGLSETARGRSFGKLRPGGLLTVRAGGGAGMFSGIIAGWSASGPKGSVSVTKEVKT